MLIKANISNMPFKKVVKIRLWVFRIFFILGLASVILSKIYPNNNFIAGFYLGFGGGVSAVGLVGLIIYKRLLRNEEKFKKTEIEHNDERNRYIFSRTFTIASYISLTFIYLAMIAAGFINLTVFKTLLCVLGAYLLVLFVTYFVIRTKY